MSLRHYLFSSFLLAATSMSSFAATATPTPSTTATAAYNPDPSLGSVAQHQRIYEIGRHFGDLNFDPDANLVGGHSKNPPNKKTHATRESTYYAYGLLLTGDPTDRARAQAILKRIVTLQDTKPGSPTYGAFNWNAEDPPGDLNSAAFIGVTLADILDLDKKHPCLDADVRTQVEASARLSVDAVMRRDVNPGYTNIAMLSIALAAAGEKFLAVPGAGKWAEAKLDIVLSLADDGEFAEYLSPTYTGVALEGAYTAKKFAFSDTFSTKADAVTNHLWKQVALSYHAPSYQLGGPYLRAYGNNMLDYAAVLKYFLYLALDGAYPLNDTETEHDWDMGCLLSLADLPVKPRPEFKAPMIPWREWTAVGSPGADVGSDNTLTRHLSQYKDATLTLGTVAYQDEWKQKRNLVAFWRNAGPPPLNMAVGFCLDESNENEAIPGFAGEKLHFYSQQVNGAALVAVVASTDVPGQGVSSLIFDDAAVTSDATGTMPFQIKDGSITAYLYPISNSNGTIHYENHPDVAHHITHVVRSWNTSDVINNLHVLSYLIVFRPSDQPAPAVSGISLKTDANGVSASAKLDGKDMSVSFKN